MAQSDFGITSDKIQVVVLSSFFAGELEKGRRGEGALHSIPRSVEMEISLLALRAPHKPLLYAL